MTAKFRDQAGGEVRFLRGRRIDAVARTVSGRGRLRRRQNRRQAEQDMVFDGHIGCRRHVAARGGCRSGRRLGLGLRRGLGRRLRLGLGQRRLRLLRLLLG